MSKKQYASDWKVINYSGLQFSEHLQLWYKDGTHYDERSARHNGLIGAGATLREQLQELQPDG